MNRITNLANQFKTRDYPHYLNLIDFSGEVLRAREKKLPLVALESTIITHGMEYPQNKETAMAVEDIVRQNGAVPATIAILDGRIKIGLDPTDLEKLAVLGKTVRKCSRRDIASILYQKSNGSTTVAATMLLANLVGIKVFVTGGIGGVHRGAEDNFDISADLIELGQTPVAVICAGAKSILDVPKTLEMLETLGVGVVGYKTSKFPEFFFSDGSCKVSTRVDSPEECAGLIRKSFIDMGFRNGMVVAVPVPKEQEANAEEVTKAIETALEEAKKYNISGQDVTPFLLKRVNELSGGDSSKSNVALIKNNASVGAKIAVELNKETQAISVYPSAKIITVGGTNVDIVSKSHQLFEPRTSNIGANKVIVGGVGRNITECLYRLGQNQTLFISVLGNDFNKELCIRNFSDNNMRTDGLIVEEGRTCTYVAMLNEKGEMMSAVADTALIDKLSPVHIDLYAKQLEKAEYVVLDANLSEATITYIIRLLEEKNPECNVVFEPVSSQKSLKILRSDSLSKISIIKPNVEELLTMCNHIRSLNKEKDVSRPQKLNLDFVKRETMYLFTKARKSPQCKLKYILTSMGSHGILLARIDQASNKIVFDHYKAAKVEKIEDVNGAGDSFVGGLVWALSKGKAIKEAIKAGQICSGLTLSSKDNISAEITEEKILKELENSGNKNKSK